MSESTKELRRGLRVGEVAPDFTLPGIQDDVVGTWTLSELRGQPVVVVFYPGDGTPVCTAQLVSYTDEIASFAEWNVTARPLMRISPSSGRYRP